MIQGEILKPLQDLKILNRTFFERIVKYHSKERNKSLAYNYLQFLERKIEIGLNVFHLISDTYYKENFHSDILKEILDPNGLHKEGSKFLNYFLTFVNNQPKKFNLKIENYSTATVEREVGRIDISIKDENSKRAIIIENKINNAPDMVKQIPRYVTYLENQGYTIDLIVYLVLSGNKQPPTHDWTKSQREEICPKILPIAAYNETSQDLYNGWLVNCERQAQNVDTLFLIRQYNNLIAYLGGKNMNQPLMEEFLQNMLVEENFKTATALDLMLQDLPNYRKIKLIETYKFDCSPFKSVFEWKNCAVISELFLNEYSFAMDIVVEKERYVIEFFERIYVNTPIQERGINPVTTLLNDLNITDNFYQDGERWKKQFLFPSEEKVLYDFINSIRSKLKNYSLVSLVHEQ